MKIEYDSRTDSAYIYLKNKIANGEVKKTFLCDPLEVRGMINLDFDKNGVLIGIEVEDASKMLPKEVLLSSERL